MSAGTLEERFDGNALNAVRLGLAVWVLLWHSYALRGDTWLPAWAERFSGDIAVDGFFAISGYLIVRSWGRSTARGYLAARAARVLPGLWVCLLFTALVLAPLSGQSSGTAKAGFLAHNWLAWPGSQPIGHTLANLPHPLSWNGSLWSLRYEIACYAVVALVGSIAVLRSKTTAWLGLTCAWLLGVAALHNGYPHSSMGTEAPRAAMMFACGGLLYAYRGKVPASRLLAAGAGLVVIVSAVTLYDYRVVAAPAVAYLAIWTGIALGRFERLKLRNDPSFGTYIYGFPVQQALLAFGVVLPWAAFAALSIGCVLPLAVLSWFMVERPAMRLARRSTRAERSQAKGWMVTPSGSSQPSTVSVLDPSA